MYDLLNLNWTKSICRSTIKHERWNGRGEGLRSYTFGQPSAVLVGEKRLYADGWSRGFLYQESLDHLSVPFCVFLQGSEAVQTDVKEFYDHNLRTRRNTWRERMSFDRGAWLLYLIFTGNGGIKTVDNVISTTREGRSWVPNVRRAGANCAGRKILREVKDRRTVISYE